MSTYTVRVKTVGYELYEVEADSPEEAMRAWDEYDPFHSEVEFVEHVSAEETQR